MFRSIWNTQGEVTSRENWKKHFFNSFVSSENNDESVARQQTDATLHFDIFPGADLM